MKRIQDTRTLEFRNAVEKIGEYVKDFIGSKPLFTEQPNSSFPLARTQITQTGITMDVIAALLPGKTIPDVVFALGVCHLPKEKLVAFFRQLLIWNNIETDVAHFAINDQTGMVLMLSVRPFEGFDYSEFKHAVQMMSTLAMKYILILNRQFGVTS